MNKKNLNENNRSMEIEKEWDIYWSQAGDKRTERKIYDIFASFYRNYLIGPTLRKIIKKNFLNGQKLLHAGCGGGETDKYINDYVEITALDISSNALKLYNNTNKNSKTILGDIFNLNNINERYDGIYNLGVMEHFSEKEIEIILNQFQFKLKDDGKIILFWPPVYALSVIALYCIHFFLNKILRNNIKLHAAEPTKIKSKKQIRRLIKNTNLKITNTSFGYSDAFTYYVVVLEKEKK
tara:strand:- start:641 stop:1354 length:714 start_codon:yes stop_codon:yes gene_type:complete